MISKEQFYKMFFLENSNKFFVFLEDSKKLFVEDFYYKYHKIIDYKSETFKIYGSELFENIDLVKEMNQYCNRFNNPNLPYDIHANWDSIATKIKDGTYPERDNGNYIIGAKYEYDYIDIVFRISDNKGKIINETLILPTIKKSKIDNKSEWNSFLPEIIGTKVAEFADNYQEEDFDDIFDEYDQEKYQIFEHWFCNCWDIATKETKIKMEAYFSVNDTNYRINLNTLKEVTDDEIQFII